MSAPDFLREELGRLVDAPPTPPDRLAAVHRRARRMHRNRVTAAVTSSVVAVVAVILVATTVAGSNRSAPVEPLAPPATQVPAGVLLANQQGAVSRLATMSDRALKPVRDLRMMPRYAPVPVSAGRILAFVVGRGLVLMDPRRPGSGRVLLRVDHFAPELDEHGDWTNSSVPFWAIPGVGPRLVERVLVERGGERLWLVTARAQAANPFNRTALDLYAMDLTGRVDPVGIHLSDLTDPVVAGRTGLYAVRASKLGPGGHLDFVRVDRSGHLSTVRRGYGADALSAGYGEAVVTHCCDGAHPVLFDADTGRSVPIAPAGRVVADLFDPQFSVDGRHVVDGPAPPVLPLKTHGNSLDSGWAYLVIDATTGRTTVVPGTTRYGVQARGTRGEAVWSGDRLLWTEQLANRTLVGAYLPANGRSLVTSVPARGLLLLGAS